MGFTHMFFCSKKDPDHLGRACSQTHTHTQMHVWSPQYTQAHAPTDLPIHPPPTSCLCSELEWLVFHFGLPGALVHSLAWPVYHYWSLSLTWTNRGPFSKVVSQVAVADVSGTAGLKAQDCGSGTPEPHEQSAGTHARLHHTWDMDSLTTRPHCSEGVASGCFVSH